MEIEGLTGDIRFNEDGRRENYTLNIMEMTVDSGMVKVADWTDRFGFVLMKKHSDGDRVQARIDYERNRTYVVTTIIEEPYLMLRKGKPGRVLEGNELYEGFCKDLADLIAHKLGINCTSRQMDCFDLILHTEFLISFFDFIIPSIKMYYAQLKMDHMVLRIRMRSAVGMASLVNWFGEYVDVFFCNVKISTARCLM